MSVPAPFPDGLRPTHIVVGAGTSGCVVAARLSEDPMCRVLLIEAGSDFPPGKEPADIADTYPGQVITNPNYFWPALRRQHLRKRGGRTEVQDLSYEQARVMGGGSSINGMVSLRGGPRDYDRWSELGARGWDWESVLPYFRKVETDRDFAGPLHGRDGPIPIGRIDRSQWDAFTLEMIRNWEDAGWRAREDMNGSFESGWGALPVANDGMRRVSAAAGYLTAAVRSRPNLVIWADTQVRKLVLEGTRVCGVEVERAEGSGEVRGDRVVLCAGALHTPWLLLRSGIGPATQLQSLGIAPVADRPGVGRRLQDHPLVSITAYLHPEVRRRPRPRHNLVNLLYSSGVQGCPSEDVVMFVIVKSAWHEIGQRLGTLGIYVGKSFSEGSVCLDPRDPAGGPQVRFNWLSDERDLRRASDAFRMMAGLMQRGRVPEVASDAFTVAYSDRVKRLGRKTTWNRLLTGLTARLLDSSALVRGLMVRHVIAGGVSIADLLADAQALDDYLREGVTGAFHPCGTCRMGAADDPLAVADPQGSVIGVQGLSVADASVMPEVPTHNTNLPTLMVGERMADLLRQAHARERRSPAQSVAPKPA